MKGQGYGVPMRHMVHGREMTVEEAAKKLKISIMRLYTYMNRHYPATLEQAYDAYMTGSASRSGHRLQRHDVGGEQLTIPEAARRFNLSEGALRTCMSGGACTLEEAVRVCQARKQARAEFQIMRALGF